jgi:hypothetical protein
MALKRGNNVLKVKMSAEPVLELVQNSEGWQKKMYCRVEENLNEKAAKID